MTEPPGWPRIFEEAIIARWANCNQATEISDEDSGVPETGDVFQRTAQSLRQNLRHVRKSLHSKHYGNIVTNIELAAAYLSIMTLVYQLFSSLFAIFYKGIFQGVVTTNSDSELYAKLDEKMRSCVFLSPVRICLTIFRSLQSSSIQEKLSDVLKDTGLNSTEFQTPLYSALSISPILLFRTCQLHCCRFGRNHYISVSTRRLSSNLALIHYS